jgi:hypothetical protein
MKFPTPESFDRHADCPARSLPLSDVERRVVQLGRADADRGDRGPPRFPRLRAALALLTGVRPIPLLADERLELLRRYAAAVRHGDDAVHMLAQQLRDVGFSADAIGTAAAIARR